jgi:hypothetical protein
MPVNARMPTVTVRSFPDSERTMVPMLTKEHILSEIRRTASENGGKALGKGRFERATGIRESDWAGRYWARWGDAIEEAGFSRNQLNPKRDDDEVLRQLVLEIRRRGRWPTTHELRLRKQEDATLPNPKVFERLGSLSARVGLVAEYCSERLDLADVLEIVTPLLAEQSPASDEPDALGEYGSVYLLKSGRHYKLGRTNAFGRREYEIGLQLPERATTVHVIKTEDPTGIEDYWHRRFADRRRNGEWFELSQADVRAFKRHKVQ